MALLKALTVDLAGELQQNARSILTSRVHDLRLQVRFGLLIFFLLPQTWFFIIRVPFQSISPILHGWITPSRFLWPWSDVHVSARSIENCDLLELSARQLSQDGGDMRPVS